MLLGSKGSSCRKKWNEKKKESWFKWFRGIPEVFRMKKLRRGDISNIDFKTAVGDNSVWKFNQARWSECT